MSVVGSDVGVVGSDVGCRIGCRFSDRMSVVGSDIESNVVFFYSVNLPLFSVGAVHPNESVNVPLDRVYHVICIYDL